MIPGPLLIISCPTCGFLMGLDTIESGNTFGAIHWSSGRVAAPMLPDIPAISKCRGYRAFFWVEDAEVKKTFYMNSKEEIESQWLNNPEIKELTLLELNRAITKGFGKTKEEELYLRNHLWWKVNKEEIRISDLIQFG